MRKPRKYLTAGLAFSAAALTAHFMQRSGAETSNAGFISAPTLSASAATSDVATTPAKRLNEVVVVTAALEPTSENLPDPNPGPNPGPFAGRSDGSIRNDFAELPLPPKDMMMPSPLPQVGVALADRMSASTIEPTRAVEIVTPPRRNEFGLTCGPILSASAKDMAMVSLTLTAPCRGDEEVMVQHGELLFSGKLDQLGTYSVDVPAFAEEAEFRVTFPDGSHVDAVIEVPMADDFERVGLLTDGQSGLQIHALEFGADYNQDGHVWSGAPRDAAFSVLENGGFLVRLGDASTSQAAVAEVYTFPNSARNQDGVVRISVEAEVTSYNCDTEVGGKTIELGRDRDVTQVAMTVAIPDCTAIGEYLVLKNLLRDLKIASN